MNADEQRAYREGQVDARLAGHDEHFARINGSLERSSAVLESVERKVEKVSDQVTGMLLVLPKIQSVADEVVRAEQVAETLRLKQLADRSTWDRYRSLAAWTGGLLVGVAVIINLSLRLAGF